MDEDNFYPIAGEYVEGLRELCQKLMSVNGVKTIVLSAGCLWKWVFLLEVFGFVVPDDVRDWPGLLEVDVFNMTIGQRQYNNNDESFNVGDVCVVSVGIFINPDCINKVTLFFLEHWNKFRRSNLPPLFPHFDLPRQESIYTHLSELPVTGWIIF